MRLSRPRVLVRVLLLSAGGFWMLWRAWAMHSAIAGLADAEAALQQRLALVWALMGALAVATAAAALRSLRPRPRQHTLHLGSGERKGP
jgi:hypothetical protein